MASGSFDENGPLFYFHDSEIMMLIHLKPSASRRDRDDVREWVESRGLRTRAYPIGDSHVVACSGPGLGADLDCGELRRRACVERLEACSHPLVARAGGDRSVVPIGDGLAAGGRDLLIAAGPCSVESRDQLSQAAWSVAAAGAGMLRGGAFKPRTSPYAFQGLGREALRLLAEVRAETGLPVVTEVMDPRLVGTVAEHADVLQIGARNMQNVPLLREVGRIERPVLLKRGLAATVEELLLAAEHVMAAGNAAVILCERGIRTFEDVARFTLDLAAVPTLQRRTHLPVLVDPSHAAGSRDLVEPLACAAVAAGADGLLVEVHPRPAESWSDADQALSEEAFAALMRRLAGFAAAAGRRLSSPCISPRQEVVG